jgi:hypothetical protein
MLDKVHLLLLMVKNSIMLKYDQHAKMIQHQTDIKMLFKLAIADLVILIVPVLGVVNVLLNPRG